MCCVYLAAFLCTHRSHSNNRIIDPILLLKVPQRSDNKILAASVLYNVIIRYVIGFLDALLSHTPLID